MQTASLRYSRLTVTDSRLYEAAPWMLYSKMAGCYLLAGEVMIWILTFRVVLSSLFWQRRGWRFLL